MRNTFILFFLPVTFFGQLGFTEKKNDLGIIPEAYEIKGDVVVKNEGEKKIFLLRADADPGVKVLASKKTLLPGDTCLLSISFLPAGEGKFTKRILLVSSEQAKPHELELKGDLKKSLKDDKQSCFYFGSRKKSNVKIKDEPILAGSPAGDTKAGEPTEPRDHSNKIPDNYSEPYQPMITFTESPPTTFTPGPGKRPLDDAPAQLSLLQYKPNNIIFLVDASGSMRDSLKLPLMKEALYTLIDAMRDVDRVSLITYADTVHVLMEAVQGTQKAEMRTLVAGMKARGYTKGRKAIIKSREIAEKHFIAEGNNQVFLATDGIFYFYDRDKENWRKQNTEHKVVLSTVAFGDDKDALKNLKEIAEAGEGSFIRIRKKDQQDVLLEEVKLRCKRE